MDCYEPNSIFHTKIIPFYYISILIDRSASSFVLSNFLCSTGDEKIEKFILYFIASSKQYFIRSITCNCIVMLIPIFPRHFRNQDIFSRFQSCLYRIILHHLGSAGNSCEIFNLVPIR